MLSTLTSRNWYPQAIRFAASGWMLFTLAACNLVRMANVELAGG